MCAQRLATKQYITHCINVLGKLELEFQHLFEMMRVDILENKLALSKYLSLLINFLSLKVSLID